MSLDPDSLRAQEFGRILLIKLSAVGDVVHTLPVLNKLRRRYPAARIDWLVTPAIGDYLRPHPAITNIVEWARHDWSTPLRPNLTAVGDMVRLLAQLRAARYELVIDLHGQFRTALFTLATGAPVRIGFDRPRAQVLAATKRKLPAAARRHAWRGAREGSWIAYTHPIRIETLDAHAVDRYLRVGPMLGLDDGPADFSCPIAGSADAGVDRLLGEHRLDPGHARSPLLVIAPGTIWETKHWTTAGFGEVARHFLRRGFAVVLIGSAREHAVCADVEAAAPGAVNLAGETSLGELAALVRRATICLTNDSGPMHLAVALDRPVVSIFGPTDQVWIGPYHRPDAVVSANRPCAPCYLRKLSRCPYDHACMHEVAADAVIARIEAELARSKLEPASELGALPLPTQVGLTNLGNH